VETGGALISVQKKGGDIVSSIAKVMAGVLAHRLRVANLADKRNFINIQNGHTIAADNYTQPMLRTGYEYIVPYKVGKLYCSVAKDSGRVIEKTDKLVTIKYDNGEIESAPIGLKYGRMEGSLYPHDLHTDLNVGSKVSKNDYISYNKNFFEKDWLDNKKLLMKFGKVITVALTMNDEVFEDGSAISSKLSKEATTTVIKEKTFIIEFDKTIINLVPEGSDVNPNTVLFNVLDTTQDYTNLSETTIDMLQTLSSLSPKAKINGKVYKYEVKYNGEVSDMSPSLRKLVTRLDKDIYEETKNTAYEVKTNRVSDEYRSSGKNLNIDTLEFKILITININQAVGDKGVFAGQMKSVIGDVYSEIITTETGDTVDAMFAYKSILNRVTNSPVMMGTTNRLIRHVSSQLADIYFS